MSASSTLKQEARHAERPVAPGSPVRVLLSERLLMDISRQAVVAFNRIRHGGIETGGVLYGSVDGEWVRCERFDVFESEHAHGPRFQLSAADCERLGAVLAADRDDQVVGWWVSHGRTGLDLTDHDRRLHAAMFPDSRHIVLVLQPSVEDGVKACVFVHAEQGYAAGSVFPVTNADLDEDDDRRGTGTRGEPLVASAPSPIAGHRRFRWTKGWVAGACAAVLLAAAGALYWANPNDARDAQRSGGAAASELRLPAPATHTESPDRARIEQLERELVRLKAQITSPRRSGEARATEEADRELQGGLGRAPVPEPRAARTFSLPPHRQPLVELVELPPPSARVEASKAGAASAEISAPGRSVFVPLAQSPEEFSGRVIWTGRLKHGGVLSIDGREPSGGYLNAGLPGRPVRVNVYPGELTTDGLILYTNDPAKDGHSEHPGPLNGWNLTVFRFNPRRAAELAVVEPPAAENGWKKLVVRAAGRAVSVVAVDWQGNY